MTCIVGVIERGKVMLGSDAGSFDGWHVDQLPDGKVWRRGSFLFGASGVARDANVLQHAFVPPPKRTGVSDDAYMSTDFVAAMRKVLRTHGRLIVKDGEERMESWVLVGWKGHLYCIDGAFTVERSVVPFGAIGVGAPYAKGSLLQSGEQADGKQRVVDALRTAEVFSAGVRGPFFLVRESGSVEALSGSMVDVPYPTR